jgi:hypothetical protein
MQQALQRIGSELEKLPSKPEEVYNFRGVPQSYRCSLGS